jgi:hybrid cluster-associated redox disulfide protein
MLKSLVPTTEMSVEDVMRRWPPTIRVFLDFGMRCVGCPIAAFHSLDEACAEHDVDVGVFLPRLLEATA